MTKIIKSIPNTLTLLNLSSGILAIISILLLNNNEYASWLIIIAGIFDVLDGLMARLLKATSNIGADLDSLSDVVSFGVAPALLIFSYIYNHCNCGDDISFRPILISSISLFIAMFAAIRLAKFNNDPTQSKEFKGLPVPANALFWIGFHHFAVQYLPDLPFRMQIVIIYLFIFIMGSLMVSNIPMVSLKSLNLKQKRWFLDPKVLIILILIHSPIVLFAKYSWSGLAYFVIMYIGLSIILDLITKFKDR